MTPSAAGYWSQHGTHTLLVLVPALLLAGLGLGADIRAWWRRGGRDRVRTVSAPMLVAAALSGVAALIHVAVCPEHFADGLVYGIFFAVSAGCQLGWSVLATVRNARWLAPAGLMGNAAIVLLWAVTRTIGIPLGPEAGEIERVGVLDLLCAGCEIGVMAICALAIRQHVHPRQKPRPGGYATRSSTV